MRVLLTTYELPNADGDDDEQDDYDELRHVFSLDEGVVTIARVKLAKEESPCGARSFGLVEHDTVELGFDSRPDLGVEVVVRIQVHPGTEAGVDLRTAELKRSRLVRSVHLLETPVVMTGELDEPAVRTDCAPQTVLGEVVESEIIHEFLVGYHLLDDVDCFHDVPF